MKTTQLAPGQGPAPGSGQGWDDVMDGGSMISSDAVVALSRAVDAAMDRGDVDEATRLASLRGGSLTAGWKLTAIPGYGMTASAY